MLLTNPTGSSLLRQTDNHNSHENHKTGRWWAPSHHSTVHASHTSASHTGGCSVLHRRSLNSPQAALPRAGCSTKPPGSRQSHKIIIIILSMHFKKKSVTAYSIEAYSLKPCYSTIALNHGLDRQTLDGSALWAPDLGGRHDY